jgi:PKD repeat protein
MRKLYALLAGFILSLASITNADAKNVSPDVANFTFTVVTPSNNVLFTNTSTIGSEPGTRSAYWHFGDGTVQMTGPLENTQHHYLVAGTYNVCLKIYRYRPNIGDSVLSAQICKTVVIETICNAEFVTLNVAANPLLKYFVAQPSHNQNKKPVKVCWIFGDGRDTCINYPITYTGAYGVSHLYLQPGNYNVCVSILYDGGCYAQKCHPVEVIVPDSCRADFERLPTTPHNNPRTVVYKALPWHNNNKKPARICWQFGDGRDTCINYTNAYTGQYTVTHTYQLHRSYEVCVNILYYGGCEARKCKTIQVGVPDTCHADFERIPSNANNPLLAYYKALPQHNNNRKPARVCWIFGDGRDTCINYTETYTGQYAVSHLYLHPGLYQVCVNIRYYGGCEASKCKPIQIGRPDSCGADFERIQVAGNPLLNYFKALPAHNNNRKPSRVCWQFGDGRDTCINYTETYTGQYAVSHLYNHHGQYEVCVNILYFGGCEARKCKPVQVGERPDSCRADFERIPSPNANPLRAYFRALPWHNNNKKPQRICWRFGDGQDTCINYPNNYTGQYVVAHNYQHNGLYEVCVNILYIGGCEAHKCKPVQVGERPDSCQADFERIPSAANNPLRAYFRALPWHNNNKKPQRICWRFGDGQDTCINYPNNYTGQYVVAHNYQHRGLYEVCVNILYFGGCEARKCHIIQIGEPDSCSADFERGPIPGTTPLTIGLKALPWNNNNRKPSRVCWEFGDGRDSCINYPETYTGLYNIVHTYPHPGQYEVCVKIFYFGGCEARKCKPIVVPPPQVNCTVRLFEITPSITSLVRGFLAVPHSDSTRRPERVCWYFGDGDDTCIMINPQQPIPNLFIRHTYPAPGVYRVCVQVRFRGGCIAEDCREVIIRPASNLCGGYMTDSLSGPRTFRFKGFSIHNPNDEVLSYRWTFGDGTSALGREVTHTYSQGGNYEVCLFITTRLGCETRICKMVRVPGNNQPALQLSPNPVINIVHVDFLSTHTEQVNIKILNGSGVAVRTYVRNVTVGPNNWNVDLTTLIPGIYSFVVQSPNQLASAIFIKL